MNNKFVLLLLTLMTWCVTNGQNQRRITGTVLNGETGSALTNASVIQLGTQNGTLTNNEGFFSLVVPPSAILEISNAGFTSQRVTVGQSDTIIVTLFSAGLMDSVIIVGYGQQKKETVTGAITQLNGAELLESPVFNVSNALVGRVAGITSTQASGEPGRNATTIRIRGLSTTNPGGQEPLIVIDGIQSVMSVVDAMDPNEIENISLLKDASATAVYGIKGGNGVIIITTKRGKSGAPKVNLTYNYGMTRLGTMPEILNSYDYAVFRNEAIRNDNNANMFNLIFSEGDYRNELWKFKNNRDYTPDEVEAMDLTPEQKQALLNSPAIYYTSRDYYREIFGGTGQQSQVNVNLSGGSERVKYFTSLGYLTQGGVFRNADFAGADINSKYNRYNFRSNFDVEILKNLSLKVDLAAIYAKTGGILGGDQDGDITQAYARQKAMTVIILAGPPFMGPGIVDGHLVGSFPKNTTTMDDKFGDGAGFSPITQLLTRPYMTNHNTNLNANFRLKHTLDYLTRGLFISGAVSYNDTYSKGIYRNRSIPVYSVRRNPENPADLILQGAKLTQQR